MEAPFEMLHEFQFLIGSLEAKDDAEKENIGKGGCFNSS